MSFFSSSIFYKILLNVKVCHRWKQAFIFFGRKTFITVLLLHSYALHIINKSVIIEFMIQQWMPTSPVSSPIRLKFVCPEPDAKTIIHNWTVANSAWLLSLIIHRFIFIFEQIKKKKMNWTTSYFFMKIVCIYVARFQQILDLTLDFRVCLSIKKHPFVRW